VRSRGAAATRRWCTRNTSRARGSSSSCTASPSLWTSDKGTWSLAITGVEVRLQDPVPQAGTYTLTNPQGKFLTLEFTRRSENEIVVEVANGQSRFSFVVRSTGAINDA